MCKIWTQEVKISKSYDRNKFTFVFLKGTLMLRYVMLCYVYVTLCDVYVYVYVYVYVIA